MGKSIWDTRFSRRGYAEDETWITIKGARVMLNDEGEIVAGAQGRFNGSKPAAIKYAKHKEKLDAVEAEIVNKNKGVLIGRGSKTAKESALKAYAKEWDAKTADYLKENEYENPPHKLDPPMAEEKAIYRIAGQELGEHDTGHCVSLSMAFIANQELNLDCKDFRGGVSQMSMSLTCDVPLSQLQESGYDAEKEGGGIWLSTASNSKDERENLRAALESMQPGRNYVCMAGHHQAVVRKNEGGDIEYLELQGDKHYAGGWRPFMFRPSYDKTTGEETTFSKESRERQFTSTFRDRFGATKEKGNAYCFSGVVPADKYANTDFFKSRIAYVNTADEDQRKVRKK